MRGTLTSVQLDRYAQVMVWALRKARRSSGTGSEYVSGDIVVLRYDSMANLLAERVYAELLDHGITVILEPTVHPGMQKVFFDHAGKRQLKFVAPWKCGLYRRMNGLIVLRASESLTHLKDCDPGKIALYSSYAGKFQEILEERERRGQFAWTLCELPTMALADQAGMSLGQYSGQVIRACHLDDDDPVARWKETIAEIDRIKKILTDMSIDYVHVSSEDGQTDLKVWIGDQRRWLGGSGHNIPSFEVFVSPEAGRAEGRFYADAPSFKLGHHVRGVRLEFRKGRAIKVTADSEEEFVRSRVGLDAGSMMIGEFSLTDRRLSRIDRFMASTLYDENIGGANGNCHIAIGNAYESSYDGPTPLSRMTPEMSDRLKFNKSAEHWDMVSTVPRTVVAYMRGGGWQTIYKNGEFTV